MCAVKKPRVWGPVEGAGQRDVVGKSGAELEGGPLGSFLQHPLRLTAGDVGPLRPKAGGRGAGEWLPLDSLVLC